MKTSFVLILLTTAIYIPAARAQCTTGIDTGGQCIPPDALEPSSDSNHAPPQRPPVVWADRWGAIAVDSGTSQVGAAMNRASKADATAQAMNDCASAGSQRCEVELTYRNQCAALAWGTRYFGLAHGPDLDAVRSDAIKSCAKGANDCKMFYSACSVAVRVQ